METELKLKVAEGDVVRLRRHRLWKDLGVAVPSLHQLSDVYYDTPELALWKNGLTLRVRAEAGRWVQTVKSAASGSAGLHERSEWETALKDSQPDAEAMAGRIQRDEIVKLLRSAVVSKHLGPVFKNETQRTIWTIQMPDGQMVECALDIGDLHAGGRSAAIGELELEMKRGDPTQLFQFALALNEDIPLEIAHDSKAARGYAMFANIGSCPAKARRIRLTKKMRLEDAFQRIGLHCMAQLESNVPGVLKGDVESLHQMRVGLRRLRALLDMFEELAPLPPALRGDLEWLSGVLGPVRDWDVLTGSTLPDVQGAELAAIHHAAGERSYAAHRKVVHSLHQPRYTAAILQINGWFHGRHWREGTHLPDKSAMAHPAEAAMLPLLRAAQKRLRKRIDRVEVSDAPGRHRVRIAAKKARYAAEFFRDFLRRRRVTRYIAELSALQERLGTLNDLDVADRLLAQLVDGDEGLARQAEFARGYIRASSVADSRRLHRPLAAVAKRRMTG